MAKKHFGICHLCGINGELTFEHVPPKSAFNDQKVIKGVFDRYANQGPDVEIKGPQQQSGIGGYTLCGKCNNTTGQWYADNYKEWTYQSVDLILKSKGENIGSYQFQIYPLRVIKQIICMFFSTNRNDFSKDYPELVRFVLNKEAKFIKPYFKFYAYLTVSNKARFSGEGQRLSVGEYGIE
ncbi:hypothetical protein, partial [Paenibacillus graminis]|uniref:hypothetical protein n=1 Tax=Paenibacillus graminis TaxID=189425 RepID=UPI0030C94AA0